MTGFTRIDPRDLTVNAYRMLAEQWALITAGTPEGFNAMVAGWGTLGSLWGLPVAVCFVRPQRYTYEFMEREPYYTLSFYPERFRKQLQVFGTKSGRDVDKVKETGFTPAFADCGAPYFEEAELVLVCKKIYTEDIRPGNFTDKALCEKWYPQKDFHRTYVGEIVEALKK